MTGALSPNEIAAGCQMASRGAGCQWGMAEETGYAAKYLARRGLFAPQTFADVLRQRPKLSPPESMAKLSPRVGCAALCPFCLGAFLSDNAAALANSGGSFAKGKPLHLHKVAAPLLVAACLPAAARLLKTALCIWWRGGSIAIMPSMAAAVSGEVHSRFRLPLAKLANDIFASANPRECIPNRQHLGAKSARACGQSNTIAPANANDDHWQKPCVVYSLTATKSAKLKTMCAPITLG